MSDLLLQKTSYEKVKRSAAIDWLRFFGSISIVYFHQGLIGSEVALSALPVFVFFLAYFGSNRPLGERARRLLTPWAIWSLFYFVVLYIQALRNNISVSSELEAWMVLVGPVIHLWFLPFAFIFLFFTSIISRKNRRLILLVTAICAYIAYNLYPLPIPFAQWFSVWPAAALGYVMRESRNPLFLGVGATLLFALLANSSFSAYSVQLCIASALCVTALSVGGLSNRYSRFFSDLSLGVYLIHPFANLLMHFAIPDSASLNEFFMFFLVFLSTLSMVILLKRIFPVSV